jgi:prolyl-tRNA synthetase
MDRAGFTRWELPLLQPESGLHASGRLKDFERSTFLLPDDNLLLAPTFEEMWLDQLAELRLEPTDLPVSYYQIGPKFRRVARPKPFNRMVQFEMCDAVGLASNPEGLTDVTHRFSSAAKELYDSCGLDPITVSHKNRAYVDHLVLDNRGEFRVQFDESIWRYSDRGDASSVKASSIGMYMLHELGDVLPAVPCYGPMPSAPATWLGSYGFGIDRILRAIVSSCRESGEWPVGLAPYDLGLVTLGPADPAVEEVRQVVERSCEDVGAHLMIDEKQALSPSPRAAWATAMGCRTVAMLGEREAASRRLVLIGPNRHVEVPLESLLDDPWKWL